MCTVVDDFQITVDICPLNIAMAGLIQDKYIYKEEEEKYIILFWNFTGRKFGLESKDNSDMPYFKGRRV